MKNQRHQKILELIHTYPIERQEDLLTRLRDEGKLGFKTGEGFQTWTPQQIEQSKEALNDYLVDMLYGK